MTISWQPTHDIKDIISGYQVSYTPCGKSGILHDVTGNTTSIELTALKPNTEYTIHVRAKTVDFGDYSASIKADTLEDGEKVLQLMFWSALCCYVILPMNEGHTKHVDHGIKLQYHHLDHTQFAT